MRELTEKETAIVIAKIKSAQLKNESLQEEFVDHVCCAIEEKIWEGASFEEAMHELSDVFKEDEMKRIETETLSLLHAKSRFMKQISWAVLPLLLAFFFYPHYTEKTRELTREMSVVLHDPPSISPLAAYHRISSSFGMRMHPIHKVKKKHKGTDFAAPLGTPVLATADGQVISLEIKNTGYGNNIIIEHDSIYQTRYAQLNEIKVKKGQLIKKGTVIGTVGSSGTSTAPHLHYEVIENGQQVDPENFLANKIE